MPKAQKNKIKKQTVTVFGRHINGSNWKRTITRDIKNVTDAGNFQIGHVTWRYDKFTVMKIAPDTWESIDTSHIQTIGVKRLLEAEGFSAKAHMQGCVEFEYPMSDDEIVKCHAQFGDSIYAKQEYMRRKLGTVLGDRKYRENYISTYFKKGKIYIQGEIVLL